MECQKLFTTPYNEMFIPSDDMSTMFKKELVATFREISILVI